MDPRQRISRDVAAGRGRRVLREARRRPDRGAHLDHHDARRQVGLQVARAAEGRGREPHRDGRQLLARWATRKRSSRCRRCRSSLPTRRRRAPSTSERSPHTKQPSRATDRSCSTRRRGRPRACGRSRPPIRSRRSRAFASVPTIRRAPRSSSAWARALRSFPSPTCRRSWPRATSTRSSPRATAAPDASSGSTCRASRRSTTRFRSASRR